MPKRIRMLKDRVVSIDGQRVYYRTGDVRMGVPDDIADSMVKHGMAEVLGGGDLSATEPSRERKVVEPENTKQSTLTLKKKGNDDAKA